MNVVGVVALIAFICLAIVYFTTDVGPEVVRGVAVVCTIVVIALVVYYVDSSEQQRQADAALHKLMDPDPRQVKYEEL